MGVAEQSKTRLDVVSDTRANVHARHEAKLAEIAARDDQTATHQDKEILRGYREQLQDFDNEMSELTEHIERETVADQQSRRIRQAVSGGVGVDDGDGIVYRTMAEYARDIILTSSGRQAAMIQAQLGNKTELDRAHQRLELVKRVNNTLSSNVEGLIPDQHIAQIFQIIDDSRPLVASAQRAELNRGTLTYPSIGTRPVVAVQASEKTAGGDTGMVIDMESLTATTYLGGGDLSWQAVNWSSPNALDLWFRLVAADYALKTEQAAAEVLTDSAFDFDITTTLTATPSFADFMTAIGAGYAAVFANSGRTANTIYMAPDRFGYLLGLTSNAFTQFTSVSGSNVGPLNVIVSRGMESGEIVVGDSAGFLVAETPGAPVELRVVEPAIGGYEVGLIGAFAAAVVDPGAFTLITAAS